MSTGTTIKPSPVPVTLDQALAMVRSSAWLPEKSLAQVEAEIRTNTPDADAHALHQYLINTSLISKEQASELKALIFHQATLPQFTFLKKLGAGGMGTVFLIRTGTGDDSRLLALKTINARLQGYEDFIGRFHRETTALAGITHEHVAGVVSSGESHGVCYLAMEYIDGPSLATMLKDSKVLPETYVLNIIRQVAEGLNHVWSVARLVHRDIKPENVLVVRSKDIIDPFPIDDVAKLIDFGLVKPSSEHEDMHLTQTGMTIGTPLYMSPEQIRGEELDCRSDIYGLAATMYHLLTGITPYSGNSPGTIMSAHLTQAVPDPGDRVPGLNPMTRKLVMTGMAKKISDRYLTYDAFIAAINAIIRDQTGRYSALPRLLRKPLVLKGPVRKTVSEIPADPASAQSQQPESTLTPKPTSAPLELAEPLSTRIVQKHHHMRTTGEKPGSGGTSHAQVVPAMGALSKPDPQTDHHVPSTSDMLRQVSTDRINKLQEAHQRDPAPFPDDQNPTQARSDSSAIFHEDPRRHAGIGILPWAVLAGSILLLVSYMVLSAMGMVG
jgi:serine/threonine protein kinase